jgi:hypothetical protein
MGQRIAPIIARGEEQGLVVLAYFLWHSLGNTFTTFSRLESSYLDSLGALLRPCPAV